LEKVICPEVSVIVLPCRDEWKLMVSPLAANDIISRNEPAPESFVLITVQTLAMDRVQKAMP